jgi:glyoxylase-like metal-dependent hydrolase (beta-lactamase superfamily II)
MKGSLTGVRVDHATTSGTFSLDGETFDVENNIWVLGDDAECIVIDAPHSVDAIMDVVGDRTEKAILLTHDDHARTAPALRERASAPIHPHSDDWPLWDLAHDESFWDHDLFDGQVFEVASSSLRVLHTPGHAPGAVCFYAPDLPCVFTGDTLFNGGPGATGRSYSDQATLETSIRRKLFELPGETIVHTGHGDDTTIGDERALMAAAAIKSRLGSRLPGEETVP